MFNKRRDVQHAKKPFKPLGEMSDRELDGEIKYRARGARVLANHEHECFRNMSAGNLARARQEKARRQGR